MTIDQAKRKLVSWCLAQVGYHEGANNYNKYAEKWTQAGGWNAQNQPYCDIFADVGFIECFGIDLASKLTYQPVGQFSALCSASADFYKRNGAWCSTPEVGDQVFFYVSGGINHTGIVVEVNGSTIITVEGNSSDSVRRNSYAIGYPTIAGYGRPNWARVFDNSQPDDSSQSDDSGTPATVIDHTQSNDEVTLTVTLPVIRYGAIGIYVKVMQTLLISKWFSCGWYGADGEYGEKTGEALKSFQSANNLAPDGICGEKTWTKLLEVT